MSVRDLMARDREVCWHPYTQHALDEDRLPVVGARGSRLQLADGRELVDAISSWWAILHGHAEPRLLEAMAKQAERLDHVLFAGATHEPAVALAEALVEAAPPGLTRVFYSDDGSTAVEVALKMVVQRWRQGGEPERRVFVALEHAYHGDTFGAMAAGDPDPFFLPFAPLLFEVRRVAVEAEAVGAALDELGRRAAGVIVEPLLQGAGGMRIHPPDFLAGVRRHCDRAGVPLIADEVLTGFGRTGTLFACEQAGIAPDLLCLAKGLTGGLFPLAATLAREEIFADFLSEERGRALFHGHTFTAHPVGCAVALASLELIRERDLPVRFREIGEALQARLAPLAELPWVRGLRRLGGLVAFNLVSPDGGGYLAETASRTRTIAARHGVLLRPLGDVIYALPPACVEEEDLEKIATAMLAVASACAPARDGA
jgi:adenosylmethionine-8-amino-7-oxononanoate aminotransferase